MRNLFFYRRLPVFLLRGLLLSALLTLLSGCSRSPLEALATIKAELHAGDYRSAEISAKDLLSRAQAAKADDLEHSARLLLARIYYQSGDHANSARFYDALLTETDTAGDGSSVAAEPSDWHQWLQVAWDSRDPRLAAKLLNHPAAPFDASARAIYALRQLLAEGQREGAIEALSLTPAPAPQAHPLVHYQFALVTSASDLSRARHLIDALAQRQPQLAAAILLQGRLQQAAGDNEAALQNYLRYIKLRPHDAQPRILAALTALLTDDYASGRTLVQSLAQAAGDHPMVLQLRAMLALHDQEFARAKTFAEQSLSRGLDSFINHLVIGIGAYQEGAWEQANRHLVRVNDQLPRDHFARKMLVEAKLQLQDTGNAAAVFKHLETDGAVDVALANRLSAQLIQQGGFDTATEVQQRVADIPTDDPQLLQQRRLVNRALQRNQFKQALLQSVQEGSADNKERLRLLLIHLADDDTEGAADVANAWLATRPDDVSALNASALVALRQGNHARAQAHLDRGLTLEPDNVPGLVMHLQQVYRDRAWPQVAAISARLLQQLDFVNALVFQQWLEANLRLQQPLWDSALHLLQASADPQLEGAWLSFLLQSRQYPLLERYLSEKVAPPQRQLRHLAAGILNALGQQQADTAAERLRALLASPHLHEANAARFAIASAARLQRFDLLLETLTAADRAGIAIERRDLVEANARLQLGQLEQVRQLLQHYPVEDSAYHETRAALAVAEKDYRLAWQHLEQAVAPELRRPHLRQLFEVGNHINRRSDTKQHIRQYFRQHPTDTLARRQVAQWYFDDSPQFAIELLDSAPMQAELQRDWVTTNNLAWLYHQTGDLANARRYAEHAIAHAPERAEVIDTYETVFGRKPEG